MNIRELLSYIFQLAPCLMEDLLWTDWSFGTLTVRRNTEETVWKWKGPSA